MVQKHWRRASKLTSCRFRCSENAIFGKNGFRKHIPETHSKLFYICGLLTSSISDLLVDRFHGVFQVHAVNPSQVHFCGVSTAKPTHICWVATSIGLLSADVLRVVLARKTSNHPKFDPTPGFHQFDSASSGRPPASWTVRGNASRVRLWF